MGFVERNLLPNEKIIAKASMHWAIFIYPVIIIIFGFLLSLVIRISPPDGLPMTSSYIFMNLMCIGFIPSLGVIAFIIVALRYLTTEFALTTNRIIAKTGILRQRSLEIMINKVESIVVNQPILGRILNYGTIIVVGSGGTRQSFPDITKPMELRQRINLQISNNK